MRRLRGAHTGHELRGVRALKQRRWGLAQHLGQLRQHVGLAAAEAHARAHARAGADATAAARRAGRDARCAHARAGRRWRADSGERRSRARRRSVRARRVARWRGRAVARSFVWQLRGCDRLGTVSCADEQQLAQARDLRLRLRELEERERVLLRPDPRAAASELRVAVQPDLGSHGGKWLSERETSPLQRASHQRLGQRRAGGGLRGSRRT